MTKAEQLRLVTFRSKFLEHAKRNGNVSATCRYFGISREKFYKWKKRFEQLGAAGLADRPTRPHHSPNATPRAVVSKVLYLRQNYHFGAGRIRDYVKRFHAIRIAGATVQNILRKHGLGRLPANQKHQPHGKRWQRYEKPQPGHRLQMDVKFLERIPGAKKRLYQFTAIDDCTRIRVLKIYDACNQSTAIDFVDEVIRRLPFRIHVVQTDNGAEFQSKFHWHLDELDIRHVFIRPRTPRLNGKVERSHRVDNEEFYQLLDKHGISDDVHLFNKKLREWENYYNYDRPHGGLGGQTPFERLLERANRKVSRKSPLPTSCRAWRTRHATIASANRNLVQNARRPAHIRARPRRCAHRARFAPAHRCDQAFPRANAPFETFVSRQRFGRVPEARAHCFAPHIAQPLGQTLVTLRRVASRCSGRLFLANRNLVQNARRPAHIRARPRRCAHRARFAPAHRCDQAYPCANAPFETFVSRQRFGRVPEARATASHHVAQ